MAISVVNEESQVAGNSATVVIEGDSPDEVTGASAKSMAIQFAQARGVGRPGVGLSGGAYPVTATGDSTDPVAAANSAGRRYRCDWPVQGGF